MLAAIEMCNCYIINDMHVNFVCSVLIAPFLLYYFLSAIAVAIFSCALSIMLIIYFFSGSVYIIHDVA